MDIICMGEMLIDFTPGAQERSYILQSRRSACQRLYCYS